MSKRTKCPECDKPVLSGQESVTITCQVPHYTRNFGYTRTHAEERTWHAECKQVSDRHYEEAQARSLADRQEMARLIAEYAARQDAEQ